MSKKNKKAKVDPFAEREASRYDKPIASRELILSYLQEEGIPLQRASIAEHFGIEDEDGLEALRRRLIAMARDGQILQDRRGAYGLADRMGLVRGRVSGHRDGFGFVIPEDGSDDYYLPQNQMTAVFDGDLVLTREAQRSARGKREAVIVEVLEHRTHEVVGRLYLESGVAFVVPDNPRINQDIRIPEHATLGAQSGQYVTVRITQQPGYRHPPVGEVTEVLGEHMAPGMEIDVALRAHNSPFRWPEAVLLEAERLPAEPAPEDAAGRVDLRRLALVTIDGEDARDFDDAVYACRKKGGGWRLYVAIADVSHYVRPGMALDEQARERGTSVYFPERVVPMLPEALSNGLCSLKPKVDRLCMVAEMTISEQGRLTGSRFYEAIMHSQARLTYDQVGAFLDAPESGKAAPVHECPPAVIQNLLDLYALYRALRTARDSRGAIDFETVETRILFDSQQKIENIVPVERHDAHKLIEECMLCANVATARLFEKLEVPILFRVHEGPSMEKLENLRLFLSELGLSIGGGNKPKTADYQALLQQVADRPDASVLQTVMLRSLSQAIYHPDNLGHFGLGYPAYLHFTSPIRRYPDLLVHRALRTLLRSERQSRLLYREAGAEPLPRAQQYRLEKSDLLVLGEHCSQTERRADEATRDVVAWLKCEYLKDRVGETFHGTVAAVVAFGLFVELEDLFVEGLVHVSSLKSDYYHFDRERHRLVGERGGQSYRLGQRVQVRVMRVDLDDRKIDLELIQQKAGAEQGAGQPRKSKRDAIIAGWREEMKQGKKPVKKAGRRKR